LKHRLAGGGETAKEKTMSRHFAAYFAIVGTLAFAPSSAANAGPFNMPHFNMAQPHFNMLRPQIGMPTHLSNMPTPYLSHSHTGTPKNTGKHYRSVPSLNGPTGQPVTPQQSTAGAASANLFSNVSGGTSGGGASGGATPSRFRVIEDGGHFAVVEGRSEKIVAGGFESYKAASAWIANHV
jgi:hypothetical protein